MLEIKDFSVLFNKIKLIDSVNFNLSKGEVVLLLGPNGSGKSSLCKGIAGWSGYKSQGVLSIDAIDYSKKNITERSRAGLFYAMQNPVEIPGINSIDFLHTSYNILHKDDPIDIWSFNDIVDELKKELKIKFDLSERNINEGFSGGEKKKFEILQFLVLKPKYAILDEIDSGLDISSIKTVFSLINQAVKNEKIGILAISHNPSILKYLNPKKVIVIEKGKFIKEGDTRLASKIIKNGFEN